MPSAVHHLFPKSCTINCAQGFPALAPRGQLCALFHRFPASGQAVLLSTFPAPTRTRRVVLSMHRKWCTAADPQPFPDQVHPTARSKRLSSPIFNANRSLHRPKVPRSAHFGENSQIGRACSTSAGSSIDSFRQSSPTDPLRRPPLRPPLASLLLLEESFSKLTRSGKFFPNTSRCPASPASNALCGQQKRPLQTHHQPQSDPPQNFSHAIRPPATICARCARRLPAARVVRSSNARRRPSSARAIPARK